MIGLVIYSVFEWNIDRVVFSVLGANLVAIARARKERVSILVK